MIFESSLISAVKGQVSCLMGEEAVILHLKSGVYFGLNPVASRIWLLIHKPKLIKSIHETLLSEFEIDSSRCESDLMTFLKRMHAVDLIQVEHDAAA